MLAATFPAFTTALVMSECVGAGGVIYSKRCTVLALPHFYAPPEFFQLTENL